MGEGMALDAAVQEHGPPLGKGAGVALLAKTGADKRRSKGRRGRRKVGLATSEEDCVGNGNRAAKEAEFHLKGEPDDRSQLEIRFIAGSRHLGQSGERRPPGSLSNRHIWAGKEFPGLSF